MEKKCPVSCGKCGEKTVSCGGHKAVSCEECPKPFFGGSSLNEHWCGGDCYWKYYQKKGTNACRSRRERPENCADQRRKCETWSRTGACESKGSGNYMQNVCPVSCGRCGGKTVSCGGHRAISCGECAKSLDGLSYSESLCGGDCYWSYSQKQESHKCQKRSGRPDNCSDQRRFCEKLSATGLCEKKTNANYMLNMCPVSCGRCGGNTVSCGGHKAMSCGECPGKYGHKSWCSGDCALKNGICMKINR